LSKQRVYSAEGTPLNFLDTNRSWRQAAVRYSKERERAFSIIEYTSQVIDCLLMSVVFARAHVKEHKILMVVKLDAYTCKLYHYAFFCEKNFTYKLLAFFSLNFVLYNYRCVSKIIIVSFVVDYIRYYENKV